MRIRSSVSNRRFRGLLLLPLAAAILFFGASCYTIGAENSWMRIQNIGSAPANIEVKYLGADGSVVASEGCPSSACAAIAPGDGWTFLEGQNQNLPRGYLGSAVITSDQPIAVLLAKDIDKGDGYFESGGDTVALNSGSDKLYLPLVLNRDSPAQNWDGRFTVQNMGGTTACATFVYVSNYTNSEVAWDPYNPKVAGQTAKPGCAKGGMPIPPGGSVFRSVLTMGVGPLFTGAVRIDLYQNDQGVAPSQQFLVASADVFNGGSHQFAEYTGLSTADMGTSVLLPLIERTADGEWSTDFQIMNADPSQAANVTLTISGYDGNNQYVSKQSQFGIQTSRQCFQDSDWANCLSPGDTLPQNFHDGIALLTSNKPIGVIASRSSNRSESYVNYRGVRTDTASQKIYLPLVNKNSSTMTLRTGWSSWVRVIAADGGWANLTVHYLSPSLPGGEIAYSTTMYRSSTIVQPWEQVLPDGFTGSMVIESDRPIVAVANVTTGYFPGDPNLMYNGVAAP